MDTTPIAVIASRTTPVGAVARRRPAGGAGIVRTRLIVLFAALMAASALVALPEPAGSRPPGPARSPGAAPLTAVVIALPDGSPAPSIPTDDLAPGAASVPEPGLPFAEYGTRPVPGSRPRVAQPASRAKVEVKNYWRFDPDISWYGPGFYGSGTACGQKYTREIMGVAHRSLPCGTRVTFRNPANGRQVTVPVIDRGPYVAGRTWDMSGAMCTYLDHCYTGTIEWRWAGLRP